MWKHLYIQSVMEHLPQENCKQGIYSLVENIIPSFPLMIARTESALSADLA